MPVSVGLPVSLLVAIGVTLTPVGAQTPNFNTALVMDSSGVIDTVTRMRTYSSLSAIATDFGTSAPVYLAAVEWFDQLPQPTSLNVGAWAQSATHGQLYGGPVSAANQLVSAWTGITTGSFAINVNTAGPQNITGLNFTGATTMAGVAAIIQTALRAVATGGYTLATCVWVPQYQYFVIASGTTGASSAVSFLSAAGSGTDISVMLAGRSTSSGAYVANGIAAETALSAVTTLDVQYGGQWYGLFVAGATDGDVEAIAPYIEAASIAPHYFGANSQEGGTITTGDTSNLAYILKQTGYNHTAVQYSSTSLYAVVSFLARILTTNWSGQNTAITLMYKQEPGIAPENLNTTQLTALLANNANAYVTYANGTSIIQPGVATSGIFVDSVIGCDVLAYTMQTNIYNALYQTPTKIPQTDSGMHVLNTVISGTCAQFVTNGLLGPGTWTAPGFGQLVEGQFMAQGYYVYQPPIASQSTSARSARQSVPFQVAAKLAGAVQSVAVSINVNS